MFYLQSSSHLVSQDWEIFSPSGALLLGSTQWPELSVFGLKKSEKKSSETRKVAKCLTKEGWSRYFWTPPIKGLIDALQEIRPHLFPTCVRVLGVSEFDFSLSVGNDCQNICFSDIRPSYLQFVNSLTFRTKEFFERDKEQIGEIFCKRPDEPNNLLTILTNDPRSAEDYGLANHPLLKFVQNFKVGLELRPDLTKQQIFEYAKAIGEGSPEQLIFWQRHPIAFEGDPFDDKNNPS